MPCDAFCSMMGEIDYDIRFRYWKELPFEKYEIINTPEYYVNVIVNENDIDLFIIEISVIKQPFNDNDWNMIGFNEFDNSRIIPGQHNVILHVEYQMGMFGVKTPSDNRLKFISGYDAVQTHGCNAGQQNHSQNNVPCSHTM